MVVLKLLDAKNANSEQTTVMQAATPKAPYRRERIVPHPANSASRLCMGPIISARCALTAAKFWVELLRCHADQSGDRLKGSVGLQDREIDLIGALVIRRTISKDDAA